MSFVVDAIARRVSGNLANRTSPVRRFITTALSARIAGERGAGFGATLEACPRASLISVGGWALSAR